MAGIACQKWVTEKSTEDNKVIFIAINSSNYSLLLINETQSKKRLLQNPSLL